MARFQRRTDEQILHAARSVLLRDGSQGFTLQAVAVEAGMSRSTLAQRVRGREHLLRRVAERGVEATRALVEGWPLVTDVQSLWALLLELAALLGPARGHVGRWPLDGQDGIDPELVQLARERNRLVLEALTRRLPPFMALPDAHASMLQAVMVGAATQWSAGQGAMQVWIAEHLRVALCVLFPDQRFALPVAAAGDVGAEAAAVEPVQAALASSR